MDQKQDLTQLESHFSFGKNWASYASGIGEIQISDADAGLSRLLGNIELTGKRFLDIGCGSGLHSLAALRLGAAEVIALDFDPDSVSTTQAVLEKFAPSGSRYKVLTMSVFELKPEALGQFDVVYSWGVLHHTGDMYRALTQAGEMVAPDGHFVFALYRKTWLCPFWKWEKKHYASGSLAFQRFAQQVYFFLMNVRLWIKGSSLRHYRESYKLNQRGMDFQHDVHDWLGGYPYESATTQEIEKFMELEGFSVERVFSEKPGRFFRAQHWLPRLWLRRIRLPQNLSPPPSSFDSHRLS